MWDLLDSVLVFSNIALALVLSLYCFCLAVGVVICVEATEETEED